MLKPTQPDPLSAAAEAAPATAETARPGVDRMSAWAGVLALSVLFLGRVFPHSPVLQGVLWPCPLKLASGVPCVTCGITRVAIDLAHGELAAAFALAPLPALLILFCLGLGVAAVVAWVRRQPGPDRLVLWLFVANPGRVTLGAIVLGLYAFTLYRFNETGLP